MNRYNSETIGWAAIAVLSILELLVLFFGAPGEFGYSPALHWMLDELASLIPIVGAFYPCSLEKQSGVALFLAATTLTFPVKLGAIYYARPVHLIHEKVGMVDRIFRAVGTTAFFLLCGVVVWMIFGSEFFWRYYANSGKVVACAPTLGFYVNWNSYLSVAIAAAWFPSTFVGAWAQELIRAKKSASTTGNSP